jgi:hypothetical protein
MAASRKVAEAEPVGEERGYVSYLLRLWQVQSADGLVGRASLELRAAASDEALPAWRICSLSWSKRPRQSTRTSRARILQSMEKRL